MTAFGAGSQAGSGEPEGAEAGRVRAAPLGWAPGSPGRAQAAGARGTLGTAGPHLAGEGSAPPPPHQGPGPEPCLSARSFYFGGTVLTSL